MYQIFLESEGFDVIPTTNGVSCMEQYIYSIENNNPFDVAILDYRMPKMDGKQVIDEIMKINPNQTIIMITGFPQEVTDYLGFSHVTVFLKPFDPDDLIARLKQVDSHKASIFAATE